VGEEAIEKKHFKLVAVAIAKQDGAQRLRDHAEQGRSREIRRKERRLGFAAASKSRAATNEGDKEVMRRKAD